MSAKPPHAIIMQQLIETILAKSDNSLMLLAIITLTVGWLLPKSKEIAGWKELFSKDRSEQLKKAREEVKDLPEERGFYDEALHEEMFYVATQIRCTKKYRRIYQKLITDGVVSVDGIRQAWRYIYEDNSRVEVRFLCIEKSMAFILCLLGLSGILAISVSLGNIASPFDISKFFNILFILSGGILCVFGSLQQLLPMVIAWNIRKRLKEQEELSSSSSAEELPPSVQDT